MATLTRFAALAALATVALIVQAQSSRPSEYQVKAAYLLNFGQFAQWRSPSNAGDTYPICVLGRDPFGASLDAVVAGGTIDGRHTVVRRIAQAKEAPGCRIVFVSGSEEGRLADTLSGLNVWRVLTVSDVPDFTKRGGMIEFTSQADHVRFEVNLAAADSSGISLSSELLKVAVRVRRTAGGG